jgi:hypothetical protein
MLGHARNGRCAERIAVGGKARKIALRPLG